MKKLYGRSRNAFYDVRFVDYLEPKLEHKSALGKAERLLLSTLEMSPANANIRLEANLLLAKLHYYW